MPQNITGKSLTFCIGTDDDCAPFLKYSCHALAQHNLLKFDNTIEIPTALEARENIFVPQNILPGIRSKKKLLLGFAEQMGGENHPVWALMVETHNVVFYRHDLTPLPPSLHRRCVLLYPFSAIGFEETVNGCSLLKSYIAVLYTALTGLFFCQGGESPTSVEAFRLASKKITDVLDKSIQQHITATSKSLFVSEHDIAHQDISSFSDTGKDTNENALFDSA